MENDSIIKNVQTTRFVKLLNDHLIISNLLGPTGTYIYEEINLSFPKQKSIEKDPN